MVTVYQRCIWVVDGLGPSVGWVGLGSVKKFGPMYSSKVFFKCLSNVYCKE